MNLAIFLSPILIMVQPQKAEVERQKYRRFGSPQGIFA
jgi:hypothetical protein